MVIRKQNRGRIYPRGGGQGQFSAAHGKKCWLKITVTLSGNSSADAPTGSPEPLPTPKTTDLYISRGTVKSECACEFEDDVGGHGGTVPGNIDFGELGGPSFDYTWSIYLGPKCGGIECEVLQWEEEVMECICKGGCGPFDFFDTPPGPITGQGWTPPVKPESPLVMSDVPNTDAGKNAALLKQITIGLHFWRGTCIYDDDCGGAVMGG